MSKTLYIKHFPNTLSQTEKEDLLKHFGAIKVWSISPTDHSVFASFSTQREAEKALYRLHQLEVDSRRLIVQYAKCGTITLKEACTDSSVATQRVKTFIKQLDAWNSSVDFYQPPPPSLKYKYPKYSTEILINILYAMSTHTPLYTQILHLMNKMSLDSPFDSVSEDAHDFFTSCFSQYLSKNTKEIVIPSCEQEQVSTSESEISTEEDFQSQPQTVLPPNPKRISRLPKVKKRPGSVFASMKPAKSAKKTVRNEEVFDDVVLKEQKKINVKPVSEDTLTKTMVEDTACTVGDISKMILDKPKESEDIQDGNTQNHYITTKQLLDNKIPLRDMKILPVFKDYHPGVPSSKLFIKNLARTVVKEDIDRIYHRYLENLGIIEVEMYDSKVMDGRMKGVAFVQLPSTEIAERALNETNGFIMKDKPLVVQFAKTPNKSNST